MSETAKQLAGGALPDAGSNGELREDRLGLRLDASKIAIRDAVVDDLGHPGLPGPGKSAGSALLSTRNCDSLPRREQRIGGQKGETLARRRYQLGTLELRGDTWTVRFREDMLQPDGTTRRVTVRKLVGSRAELPTRKLARRRADEIVSRVNRLDYKPIRVAAFAEFVEIWKTRALSLMKPSTQKAAQAHLRILVSYFEKMRLDEFGAGLVQVFVTAMAAKGRSRHYVKNVLATLQSVLRSARSWGYLVGEVHGRDLVLPCDGIRRAARFFTAEQATAIINAAGEPWRTIFAVAAMTALRPGEVLGLSVDDLDFGLRLIRVRQTAYYAKLQTPKSRSSVAPVPMPGPLEAMLREFLQTWKPNPSRLLFATRTGTPFAANNLVQRKLWPILDALKIPRCGMHAFRHTHASLLVSLGASPAVAQRQLRHADVGTTLGIYTHVLGGEQREAAEKVARQLRPDVTIATKTEPQDQWLQ